MTSAVVTRRCRTPKKNIILRLFDFWWKQILRRAAVPYLYYIIVFKFSRLAYPCVRMIRWLFYVPVWEIQYYCVNHCTCVCVYNTFSSAIPSLLNAKSHSARRAVAPLDDDTYFTSTCYPRSHHPHKYNIKWLSFNRKLVDDNILNIFRRKPCTISIKSVPFVPYRVC